MIDAGTIFGVAKPYGAGRFSAPFLSANTAATYYGVLGLLALAQLLRKSRRLDGLSISVKIERGVKFFALPASVFLLAMTLMFLSGSRGGVTFGGLAAIALIVWEQPFKAARQSEGGAGFPVALVAVVAIAAMFILSGELYRLRIENLTDHTRTAVYTAYLDSIALYPLFGQGLGGFQFTNDLIAQADNAHAIQFQGAAHNLVLQWLLQAGILGTLAASTMVMAAVRTLWLGLKRRRRQRTYLKAVMVILGFVFAHGMVDYGLEIPMVAWFVALVLGAGLGIAGRGQRR